MTERDIDLIMERTMEQKKVSDILRHMRRVEDNCERLADSLSDFDFALQLVQRGRLHDASKLDVFEFNNLDMKSPDFYVALKRHHYHNPHHPEHHKDIFAMSDLDVAEMVCDCLARAQEFGTDIKKWFFEEAPSKYHYERGDRVWNLINGYLDLLLTPKF